MKEELEQRLLNYMDKTADAVENLAELGMEHLPKFVQEYVTWGIVDGLIGIAVGIFWFATVYVIYRIILKIIAATKQPDFDKYNDCTPVYNSLLGILAAGCLIAAMSITVNNISQVSKAYFTPSVYIIDNLRGE